MEIRDLRRGEFQILNGIATYDLIPGDPNISSALDFLKSIQIAAFDLLPDGNKGNNTTSQTKDAIVVGTKARASTFATVTPQLPVMILRDPPGDESYSHIEQSQTMTTSNRFYALANATENIWTTTKTGTKFETGVLGFSTEVDVSSDIGNSLESSQTLLNSEEMLTSITTKTAFSTSDNSLVIGSKGDVFIGAAMNLSYAAADVLAFDMANCRIVEDVKLVIGSDGYIPSTTYVYTEDHIRSAVIPGLQLLADFTPNPDSALYYLDQIKSWEQVIKLNEDLKKSAIDYGTNHNYSFNGGAGAIEESTIASATTTTTYEFSLEIDAGIALEAGIEAAGVGFEGGVMVNLRAETGDAQETTLTDEIEVGYVIDDDDPYDAFSVDIFVDPVYQTPIFKTFGSETSCPFEEGSLPIDDPGIVIQNPVQTGIAPNNSALFTFNLFHSGQSSNTNTNERKYRLELNSGSNPDGATITIGGIQQGSEEYDILKSSPQQVTVTVTKLGASSVYSYEGLEFLLYPACYDAASFAALAGQLASAKLSVFF